MVKGGMTSGIYLNHLCYCAIRLGLLIADFDAKYGLIGDAIAITLLAYVDAQIYKHVIIIVGMSPIIGCVTLGVAGTLVPCGGEIATSSDIVESDIWLIIGKLTLVVVEVPTLTVEYIGCSSTFKALFYIGFF